MKYEIEALIIILILLLITEIFEGMANNQQTTENLAAVTIYNDRSTTTGTMNTTETAHEMASKDVKNGSSTNYLNTFQSTLVLASLVKFL